MLIIARLNGGQQNLNGIHSATQTIMYLRAVVQKTVMYSKLQEIKTV